MINKEAKNNEYVWCSNLKFNYGVLTFKFNNLSQLFRLLEITINLVSGELFTQRLSKK